MNASPPGDPGRDLDAEALARVLDGLELDADADDAERAAHTRAEDDVAALRRAFVLMGDALAAPAEPTSAAAAPVAEDEGHDAVVIPFATRLRRRAPILAAAASLIAVVGLGAVMVTNDNLSGNENDSTVSAGRAPSPAADAADAADAAAPAAPEASSARRNAEEDGVSALSSDSAAKAPAAAAKTGAADQASPAEGEAAPAAESTTSGSTSKKETKAATRSALDVAVSCNRGVFIGRVLSITPAGERYELRVAVTDWISPSSGATAREFTVGKSYANTPDGRTDLKLGQEWLFVVPGSLDRAVRAFAGPDYSEAREQVAAAQERTADDDC